MCDTATTARSTDEKERMEVEEQTVNAIASPSDVDSKTQPEGVAESGQQGGSQTLESPMKTDSDDSPRKGKKESSMEADTHEHTSEQETTGNAEDINGQQMEIEKADTEDESKKTDASSSEEIVLPKTPRRGRPPKNAAATTAPPKTPKTPTRGGRKRKPSDSILATTTNDSATAKRNRKLKLQFEDFASSCVGSRVLTCGEGDQLGHPGRTTTKKPRKVDIVEEEDMSIVQVVSGGVHSAILTVNGDVYMCGINEKGTVPAEGVEAEGSTDEFKKIIFSDEITSHGKIVMLTAGASFTAALTEFGSVIAWGNLRDGSGKIDVHQQLTTMQEKPIIVVKHRKDCVIVKIAAGENHLVMLTEDGSVLTFGDCSMGQLGRTARLGTIRPQYMAADSTASLHVIVMHNRKKAVFKNIFAGGFWTAMITEAGDVFVCGLNNFAQLGVPFSELDDLQEAESTGDAGADEDKKDLRIKLPKLSKALSGHKWTNIEGVQHLVCLDDQGDVYAIGKNTDNALGLGTWTGNDDSEHWRYDSLQKVELPNKALGITAKLGCSIAWTENGAFSWGCDTSGQLGLGLKDDDDKVVAKPEAISSAHLDGFRIQQVSIADNHSVFLAAKAE